MHLIPMILNHIKFISLPFSMLTGMHVEFHVRVWSLSDFLVCVEFHDPLF